MDFSLDMFPKFKAWLDSKQPARPIARDSVKGAIVSTVEPPDLTDGFKFETAIKHPFYQNGEHFVVVQRYKTKEALQGHAEWIQKVKSNMLPKTIQHPDTDELGQVAKIFGVTPPSHSRQDNSELN